MDGVECCHRARCGPTLRDTDHHGVGDARWQMRAGSPLDAHAGRGPRGDRRGPSGPNNLRFYPEQVRKQQR